MEEVLKTDKKRHGKYAPQVQEARRHLNNCTCNCHKPYLPGYRIGQTLCSWCLTANYLNLKNNIK